jgi:serine/threonine protein kinase
MEPEVDDPRRAHVEPPRLPGYHIFERLGAGGQAAVYRGVHIDSGKQVAIKCYDMRRLNEDHSSRMAAQNEIRSMIAMEGRCSSTSACVFALPTCT